jgi:hypothetical protein
MFGQTDYSKHKQYILETQMQIYTIQMQIS